MYLGIEGKKCADMGRRCMLEEGIEMEKFCRFVLDGRENLWRGGEAWEKGICAGEEDWEGLCCTIYLFCTPDPYCALHTPLP